MIQNKKEIQPARNKLLVFQNLPPPRHKADKIFKASHKPFPEPLKNQISQRLDWLHFSKDPVNVRIKHTVLNQYIKSGLPIHTVDPRRPSKFYQSKLTYTKLKDLLNLLVGTTAFKKRTLGDFLVIATNFKRKGCIALLKRIYNPRFKI